MAPHNAIDAAFAGARAGGRAALMPYITAGFPGPDGWADLAVAALEAGADMLEIGIPFSDPLLDGPVIQRSQQAALDAGVTPADCLRYAGEVHARTPKALLFMGAFNPLMAYGLDAFCEQAANAGICGLIVPDLPLEEGEELRAIAATHNLHLIGMVAPTSTEDRMRRVCAAASGFIYCISVAGVTGARKNVAETAKPLVDAIKACTDVPVAVGFGIGDAQSAHDVGRFADGVIVGAALINVLAQAGPGHAISHAAAFVGELRTALERDSRAVML